MFKDDPQKIYSFSRVVMFVFFLTVAIALGVFVVRGFKLGVDFAGGVVFDFSVSEQGLTVDNVSKRIKTEFPDQEFVLQNMNDDRFSLRVGGSKGDYDAFVNSFRSKIGDIFQGVKFHQVESIGPQAGKTLIKHGIYAVTLSFVTIMLYLLLRFSMPFALSAVLVLLCNVVFVSGVVSAFGLEVNLTMVASFLTIIGYCVNDTVVLYDRIRTNIAFMSKRKIVECISVSISQMFRRSVITSFVTMLAVLGIMFFSDKAIRNFAIVLICGIVFGTIGSVFVASILPLKLGLKRSSSK